MLKGASLKIINLLYAVFLVAMISVALSACKGNSDDQNNFDAASFYAANTVEIISIGDYGEQIYGTGLILYGDEQPIIATNYHVAGEEGSLISVRFAGESKFVNSDTFFNESIIEVLKFDKYLDICIFKVDYTPINYYNNLLEPLPISRIVPLSSGHKLSSGDMVMSYGNKLGEGIQKFEGEVVDSELIVPTKSGLMPLIRTTLSTEYGCSGGVMFDESGRFLGLTSYGGEPIDELYNYSISSLFVDYLQMDTIDGQIDRLDFEIKLLDEELFSKKAEICFTQLDISLRIDDNSDIFCSSYSIGDKIEGYKLILFGKRNVPDNLTQVLAEAMRYHSSDVVSNDILRLEFILDGAVEQIEFSNINAKY